MNNGGRVYMSELAEQLGTAPGAPPDENMVWVPGGTFQMGSDRHYPEEAPAHSVTVDGFWMDRFTVTNDAIPSLCRRHPLCDRGRTTTEQGRLSGCQARIAGAVVDGVPESWPSR